MLMTILGGALITFLAILLLMLLFLVVVHLSLFHRHKCPHCTHIMEYKGLREDGDESHFLFFCPKCGRWQQIPRGEFIRDCGKSMNLNDI